MTFDFHLKNNSSKAVLLFHGLTGSPYELKKYAQFLFHNGYDVYANSLPGHGDDIENIYSVKYTTWLDFAYYHFEQLSKKYDEVYVSGICLGAVLALFVAIKYKLKVKGVISLSTTLFLDGWRLPWYKFLLPIALSTIIRFYYNYPECEPYGIKNEKTRNIIKKLLKLGDVGLNDFPMSAIWELIKLSKKARTHLNKIEAPILIIHSKLDDLTSPKSAKLVFENVKSEKKEMIILNNSYHMVLYDNEKDFVFEKSLKFLKSLSKVKEKEALLCY